MLGHQIKRGATLRFDYGFGESGSIGMPLFGFGESGSIGIPLLGFGESGSIGIPLLGFGESGSIGMPLAYEIAMFVTAMAMMVITSERVRLAVRDMVFSPEWVGFALLFRSVWAG
jgi:hypothetical protein